MAFQERIVDIVRDNRDALVRVNAAHNGQTPEAKTQVVIGTGFFISRKGLILTNASIVHEADRLWVEHRGVSYAADLVGTDRPSNVALLRLDNVPEEFGFFHLTDLPELPPVGQWVLRLSMPLLFDPSPRMGMVAGFESGYGGQLFPCKYMRVTVAAGPGEGGAAYLDLSGRLIGIQVATLQEVDSSYILPARAALRIRDDLLFNGEVTFGWMGFTVSEEATIADGRRLSLAAVDPGTPAEVAGLQANDALIRIGDYTIRNIDDLRNAMFYTRVGQFVEVEVWREGQRRVFSVKLAERPSDEPLTVVRPLTLTPGTMSPVDEKDADDSPPSPLLPRESIVPPNPVRSDVPIQGGP